ELAQGVPVRPLCPNGVVPLHGLGVGLAVPLALAVGEFFSQGPGMGEAGHDAESLQEQVDDFPEVTSADDGIDERPVFCQPRRQPGFLFRREIEYAFGEMVGIRHILAPYVVGPAPAGSPDGAARDAGRAAWPRSLQPARPSRRSYYCRASADRPPLSLPPRF